MGKPIYFSSIKKGSGKSAVCLGLVGNVKDDGKNPAYFKPIGEPYSHNKDIKMDKDVIALIETLNLTTPAESVCPVLLTPDYFFDEITTKESESKLKIIKESFDKISANHDIVIVEGNHKMDQFRFLKLDDISIAKSIGAEIILMAPLKDDSDFDDLANSIELVSLSDVKIKGVIINYMNQPNETRIKEYYKPSLDLLKVPILGEIKSYKELEYPTIEELRISVNGRVITSDYDSLKDQLIEGYHVAGMGVAAALSYLRQGINNCVICGGDRVDIMFAAFEASTRVIILSGNIEPDTQVIAMANEKKIPIIVAPTSTYQTTYNVIKNVKISIQPSELNLCKELVKNNIQWKKIIK